MKIKVVYNNCYGYFALSNDAIHWLSTHGVTTDIYGLNLVRHHSLLVECVEALGDKASGLYSKLQVMQLQGNKYRIDEYDGKERVVEPNEAEWTTVD